MINRLTDGLNFNAQALTLRAERQRLIASNIANADTPGYVARDFNFAQALREATGATRLASGGSQPADYNAVSTQALVQRNLLYATPSQTNLDGNTVDMDRERATFAENAIKYESTLRFVNGQVKTMMDAIKGNSS
ncbi:MAG: flagellar basal body rod protein FlgB [Burkholderiales bacterium]|nr:MAG: flagellar basal body rod protein FlgB [Burkholderiales bacterium]